MTTIIFAIVPTYIFFYTLLYARLYPRGKLIGLNKQRRALGQVFTSDFKFKNRVNVIYNEITVNPLIF